MKEMEIPHDLLEKLEAVSNETGWQIDAIISEAMMCYLSDLEAAWEGDETMKRVLAGKEKLVKLTQRDKS